MAAYRRVYDSRHLQADCQEPGSAPEPYARYSSMGYLYFFYQLIQVVLEKRPLNGVEKLNTPTPFVCFTEVNWWRPENSRFFAPNFFTAQRTWVHFGPLIGWSLAHKMLFFKLEFSCN